ncbi:uncharacterized protein LOC131676313 isoform X2 [Topomyia yanbarensis]|uniref:uncharacterized protein LOC131676313 isoform X2 n=1 Tax=Topomyia yanbarensis TaxID=2498891 RepID=UPI00273AEE05|nr:uncharacterized protein LOC131676313 isoform X2 [Topomyia yanbarensis]
MAEHLLQRFATMGSSSTAGPPSSMATLSQRIHHEPFVKYPVYGPGSGPDIYEDGGDFWQGESGPGFFPGGPPVPPPPPLPPFPFRAPYGKFGKTRFKGASVAVLTFIGFLFFLSVLQNYIRDYSTTNTPTVIVLSSGATKENQQQYPFLQKNDLHLSEEEHDEYQPNYKKAPAHGKRPKNQKRQTPSKVAPSKQASFSDLISVSGLKKK